VVLEKDGEDQLDRSCEKWRSDTKNQGGEEYPIKVKVIPLQARCAPEGR